jgi:hypothetical protein
MSDWTSTYDGIAAANGGLDLEMPAGVFMNRQTLLPAIQQGKVTVASSGSVIYGGNTTYNTNGVDVLGVESTGSVIIAQWAVDRTATSPSGRLSSPRTACGRPTRTAAARPAATASALPARSAS